MKKHLLFFAALFFICNILFVSQLNAQRPMEKLSRSVVAQKCLQACLRTGASLRTNGTILPTNFIAMAIWFTKQEPQVLRTTSTQAAHRLRCVHCGGSKKRCAIGSFGSGHCTFRKLLEIPLRDLKKLGKTDICPTMPLLPTSMAMAKWKSFWNAWKKTKSSECNDFTYFEAYKLDGTFLWANRRRSEYHHGCGN